MEYPGINPEPFKVNVQRNFGGLTYTYLEDIIKDLSLHNESFSFQISFKGKRQRARWFRKFNRMIKERNSLLTKK